MPHLVLLGDSIFDNQPYVPDGKAVIHHLRGMLDPGWQATLLAADGSSTEDVAGQLERLPGDASHLAISVGGNNAILSSGILMERSETVGESLLKLKQVVDGFEKDYGRMLEHVAAVGKPMVLCTIYHPNFADELYQEVTTAGLMLFNDPIIRAAHSRKLPLIDLRLVCTETTDYANEIEPSVTGGKKIAAAVWQAVSSHDAGSGRMSVDTGV